MFTEYTRRWDSTASISYGASVYKPTRVSATQPRSRSMPRRGFCPQAVPAWSPTGAAAARTLAAPLSHTHVWVVVKFNQCPAAAAAAWATEDRPLSLSIASCVGISLSFPLSPTTLPLLQRRVCRYITAHHGNPRRARWLVVVVVSAADNFWAALPRFRLFVRTCSLSPVSAATALYRWACVAWRYVTPPR